MPLVFADNFLAGALLTLILPTVLLTVIVTWYMFELKRVPKDIPSASTTVPSADVLAAAEEQRTGAGEEPPATRA